MGHCAILDSSSSINSLFRAHYLLVIDFQNTDYSLTKRDSLGLIFDELVTFPREFFQRFISR